ncbi:uncharacterized protein N7443_009524, partial [Penicillium atrosanguineum]|uniref:uncharacterized protein n=1 Tax=Penicillium atrosanguineum TaxID=1132637 RepID=UPI0023847601
RQSAIRQQIKRYFISGNNHKLVEAQAILGIAIEVSSKTVDAPEIQETIEEIAEERARRTSAAINGHALAEDKALYFHALNGLPRP